MDIFVNYKNHLKKIFITIGKCYTTYIISEVIFLSENVLKDMGERIYKRRKALKLTQEELAEQVETSRVYISNIERGEAAPSLEMLLSIANVLNVSADDLLAGNLLSANTTRTEEEIDILSDCSQEESRILLESMRAIKQVLRGYNITK